MAQTPHAPPAGFDDLAHQRWNSGTPVQLGEQIFHNLVIALYTHQIHVTEGPGERHPPADIIAQGAIDILNGSNAGIDQRAGFPEHGV